jgi:indoleamine 2,3-dioxygenase
MKSGLANITASITAIDTAMMRMGERLSPDIFMGQMRRYFSGWRGNSALPNGLVYEGVDDDTPMSVDTHAAISK